MDCPRLSGRRVRRRSQDRQLPELRQRVHRRHQKEVQVLQEVRPHRGH